MNGTFSSGDIENTQDLTPIAARACWHFLQGFLSAFPHYNPGIRSGDAIVNPTDVHLFAESYGGTYGPTFADFFEDQNDRRKNGTISSNALDIHIGSVGIVNGMVDLLTSAVAAVNFTHHNTYGIEHMGLLTFQNAISDINSEDGCKDQTTRCREKVADTDREGFGDDQETNVLCSKALYACDKVLFGELYSNGSINPYAVRGKSGSSYGAAYQEYLNSAEVLRSIGSPVNFTQSSITVSRAFNRSKSLFVVLTYLELAFNDFWHRW
jgi:carboxypeptidase C (cathepsin A)